MPNQSHPALPIPKLDSGRAKNTRVCGRSQAKRAAPAWGSSIRFEMPPARQYLAGRGASQHAKFTYAVGDPRNQLHHRYIKCQKFVHHGTDVVRGVVVIIVHMHNNVACRVLFLTVPDGVFKSDSNCTCRMLQQPVAPISECFFAFRSLFYI